MFVKDFLLRSRQTLAPSSSSETLKHFHHFSSDPSHMTPSPFRATNRLSAMQVQRHPSGEGKGQPSFAARSVLILHPVFDSHKPNFERLVPIPSCMKYCHTEIRRIVFCAQPHGSRSTRLVVIIFHVLPCMSDMAGVVAAG